MSVIRKIVLIYIMLLYGIVLANSFSCGDFIRRFGPNSYITRIPLFFEANKNSSTHTKQRKKEYKTINPQAKKIATQLRVGNFFDASENEQLNLFVFSRLLSTWSDRNSTDVSRFFKA